MNNGFLFVCNTPPRRLLWLHFAVRSLVGRRLSELRVTFPMNNPIKYHHKKINICFFGINTSYLSVIGDNIAESDVQSHIEDYL